MSKRLRAFGLASSIASLLVAACANRPLPASADATLYQRLGGKPAIAAVVGDAIANAATDARISERFRSTDADRLKASLIEFLCDRSGGPCTYRGRNMADAHEGMLIRDDEFDALVDDLVRALDKHRVAARERGEILGMLARMKNAITDH